MNEETTTSTPVDDTQAPAEQPDTTEQAVQEQETSETSPSEESTPDSEEDIKAWAEKKGLDYNPENPNEAKLAKMVFEGDKKVTEATQKASDLGKSVETASTALGLDDVAELKNKVAVMEFYQTYPDARQLDSEMAKTLDDKPYFANDLEALYFFTKGQQADKNLVAARQAGNKEALEAAAQAERASAPKASASVRTSPKQLTNEDIKNMSLAEYEAAKEAGQIIPFR